MIGSEIFQNLDIVAGAHSSNDCNKCQGDLLKVRGSRWHIVVERKKCFMCKARHIDRKGVVVMIDGVTLFR